MATGGGGRVSPQQWGDVTVSPPAGVGAWGVVILVDPVGKQLRKEP